MKYGHQCILYRNDARDGHNAPISVATANTRSMAKLQQRKPTAASMPSEEAKGASPVR